MTKRRWVRETVSVAEVPDVDAFLEEVLAVCEKHGLGLSHEDGNGAFEIVSYEDSDDDWLFDATDARKLGRPVANRDASGELSEASPRKGSPT